MFKKSANDFDGQKAGIRNSDRLLTFAEVCDRVGGVNRSTIWRWLRSGEFVLPVQLGRRRVGFWASEVDAWLASRPTATAYRGLTE